MNDVFNLNAGNIYIYGAATTGALVYNNLVSMGFLVSAFIDSRGDEIQSYYNLPVFGMEEFQQQVVDKQNVIVVIAIKNVFEHQTIANEFIKRDICKIVYRPKSVLDQNGNYVLGQKEKDEKINLLYNSILNKEFISYENIPTSNNSIFIPYKDYGIIQEDEDYVIALISKFFIYTDLYQNREVVWGDISIMGLLPHLELFRMFQGDEVGDIEMYLKFCHEAANRSGGIVTSKRWELSILNNRLDVFNHMENSLEFDYDFFIRNAVPANLNEKGYFNIKSGKHRIIFLLVKGKSYFPLRIKKEEYKHWVHESESYDLYNTLATTNSGKNCNLFLHPYAYNAVDNRTVCYQQIMEKIVTKIYYHFYNTEKKFLFHQKKLFIQQEFMKYFDFLFCLLGFPTTSIYDNKRSVLENVISKYIEFDNSKLERLTIHELDIIDYSEYELFIVDMEHYEKIDKQVSNSIFFVFQIYTSFIDYKNENESCEEIYKGFDGTNFFRVLFFVK